MRHFAEELQPLKYAVTYKIADDFLASKPYAASVNYINKISDYYQSCVYSHKESVGEKACPFNFFYWNFLDQHRDKLQTQGRMKFILKKLDKMAAEELQSIRHQARNWQNRL